MKTDTNFYLQALEEFKEKNPQLRRVEDMTPGLLSSIVRRAQELKDSYICSGCSIYKPEDNGCESELERARR